MVHGANSDRLLPIAHGPPRTRSRISLLSLTGLVVSIALCAGGTSAFAAIWLAVVPRTPSGAARRHAGRSSRFPWGRYC
jgi:hypothetical protein